MTAALALFEFNGDGLAILVLGPAVVGVLSLILALMLFSAAQGQKVSRAKRIALNVLGAILLTLALGIGACFGVVMH